jgi:hypothetical protein
MIDNNLNQLQETKMYTKMEQCNVNQVPHIRKMIRNNANANVLHGFNATTSLGTPLNDAPKVMDSLQNEKPCFGNYDDALGRML